MEGSDPDLPGPEILQTEVVLGCLLHLWVQAQGLFLNLVKI